MRKGMLLGSSVPSPANLDWRSRGYIPHFDQPQRIQFITLRLYDAVPEAVIAKWKEELLWAGKVSASDPRQVDLRKRIEKYEDAGYGACWLRDKRVAELVEQTLLHYDGNKYRILAWCIMPNHVHVIVEMLGKFALSEILHSWKSYIAHKVNKLLNRSGIFWFREYHDRLIRDAEHLAAAVNYVETNPVKARLVTRKEEWEWSSASKRGRGKGGH
jgi:REP element-mobilizing transposase RayT